MRVVHSSRTARAILCSILLLSQHAIVDAKGWVKSQPSRSSTLAVAVPGGRDRPLRDWKAFGRDAKKKIEESDLKKKVETKAEEAGEALEEALPGGSTGDVEETVRAEAAAADPFDLEKATPQSIAILLGKVVVVTAVGLYVAKKAVAFTKAFHKARKDGKARRDAAADAFATASPTTGTGDGVGEVLSDLKDAVEE